MKKILTSLFSLFLVALPTLNSNHSANLKNADTDKIQPNINSNLSFSDDKNHQIFAAQKNNVWTSGQDNNGNQFAVVSFADSGNVNFYIYYKNAGSQNWNSIKFTDAALTNTTSYFRFSLALDKNTKQSFPVILVKNSTGNDDSFALFALIPVNPLNPTWQIIKADMGAASIISNNFGYQYSYNQDKKSYDVLTSTLLVNKGTLSFLQYVYINVSTSKIDLSSQEQIDNTGYDAIVSSPVNVWDTADPISNFSYCSFCTATKFIILKKNTVNQWVGPNTNQKYFSFNQFQAQPNLTINDMSVTPLYNPTIILNNSSFADFMFSIATNEGAFRFKLSDLLDFNANIVADMSNINIVSRLDYFYYEDPNKPPFHGGGLKNNNVLLIKSDFYGDILLVCDQDSLNPNGVLQTAWNWANSFTAVDATTESFTSDKIADINFTFNYFNTLYISGLYDNSSTSDRENGSLMFQDSVTWPDTPQKNSQTAKDYQNIVKALTITFSLLAASIFIATSVYYYRKHKKIKREFNF